MEEKTLALMDFRGGFSPEANRGARGAFRTGQNLDIRSGDNTLKCNQKLKKDSSTTVVDLVLTGFRASDGKQYAFGDTGKIYRKATTTWELVYTDTDGKITGASEFTFLFSGSYTSHLVWATQTKLKSIPLATAGSGSWSTGIVTQGTFAVGSASYYHTMRVAAGALMICDGHDLAMLDYEGVFSTAGVSLTEGNEGRSLYERNGTIVIGTEGSATQEGWIFTWDGIQDSWILKRPAQGDKVNTMIPLEGGMLLQVGSLGHLRFWNYSEVSPLMQVLDSKWAYPGGSCEFNTIPHFGMNGGTKNGVYSVGRINKNEVVALNLEYIPSHGKITGTDIGAIWKDGTTLFVAWKDSTTYGIDIIDTANKAIAVYESLANDMGAPQYKKFATQLKINAKTAIPTGCTVTPYYKTPTDSDWVAMKCEDDNETMIAGDTERIFGMEAYGATVEIKLVLTPSVNTTPEISAAFVFYKFEETI
jgi:uncharacterized protein YaiE (UPF0345 family)